MTIRNRHVSNDGYASKGFTIFTKLIRNSDILKL